MKKLFNHFEEICSCFVFIAMLSITFMNVVSRYCLKASISFTEEITCALFVLLCMLGTAIAAKCQEHLGLSLVTEVVKESTRRRLAVFGNVLGVIFSVVLFVSGISMVMLEYDLRQISVALQLPEWIYGSFLPFGAFWMIIRFGQASINIMLNRKEEE